MATSHESGVHKTGSARSEGYYKIDPMAKKAYLRHSLPSFATPTPKSETTKKEVWSRHVEGAGWVCIISSYVSILLKVVTYFHNKAVVPG